MPLYLLATLAVLAGCTTEKGYGKPNPDFLVVGHRGAPYAAPENTIPAFAAAIEQGANAIETDFCVTADGVVVIWHDRDPDDSVAVARQSGLERLPWVPVVPADESPLHRPVDELTLAELRSAYGYGTSTGTRDPSITIPVLADLVAWAATARDLRALYVDVKVGATQTDDATFLFDTIVAAWNAETALNDVDLIFISPHRGIVEALIAARTAAGMAAENVRIARDFEDSGALAGTEALMLTDVSTGLTIVRTETEYFEEIEELVEARKKGRIETITTWTIDRRSQMFRLLYFGVDATMTNRPDVLHDFWQDTLH